MAHGNRMKEMLTVCAVWFCYCRNSLDRYSCWQEAGVRQIRLLLRLQL